MSRPAPSEGPYSPPARVSIDSHALEWVLIEPEGVVVATPGRVWLHRPSPLSFADPFLLPMSGPGRVATTRRLLDGVISLAARRAPARPPRRTLSLEQWVWSLITQYHTTRPTPGLVREAARGLQEAGHLEAAAYAACYAEEEACDDELALRDLEALGYQAEDLVKAIVPPAAKTIIAHFEDTVRSTDPIGFLGYAYAGERLALGIGQRFLDEIASILPPGVDATRCARAHSSLGADLRHVAESVAFIATQPAADRVLVARVCYETALIILSLDDSEDVHQEQLQRRLAPFRHRR